MFICECCEYSSVNSRSCSTSQLLYIHIYKCMHACMYHIHIAHGENACCTAICTKSTLVLKDKCAHAKHVFTSLCQEEVLVRFSSMTSEILSLSSPPSTGLVRTTVAL